MLNAFVIYISYYTYYDILTMVGVAYMVKGGVILFIYLHCKKCV